MGDEEKQKMKEQNQPTTPAKQERILKQGKSPSTRQRIFNPLAAGLTFGSAFLGAAQGPATEFAQTNPQPTPIPTERIALAESSEVVIEPIEIDEELVSQIETVLDFDIRAEVPDISGSRITINEQEYQLLAYTDSRDGDERAVLKVGEDWIQLFSYEAEGADGKSYTAWYRDADPDTVGVDLEPVIFWRGTTQEEWNALPDTERVIYFQPPYSDGPIQEIPVPAQENPSDFIRAKTRGVETVNSPMEAISESGEYQGTVPIDETIREQEHIVDYDAEISLTRDQITIDGETYEISAPGMNLGLTETKDLEEFGTDYTFAGVIIGKLGERTIPAFSVPQEIVSELGMTPEQVAQFTFGAMRVHDILVVTKSREGNLMRVIVPIPDPYVLTIYFPGHNELGGLPATADALRYLEPGIVVGATVTELDIDGLSAFVELAITLERDWLNEEEQKVVDRDTTLGYFLQSNIRQLEDSLQTGTIDTGIPWTMRTFGARAK